MNPSERSRVVRFADAQARIPGPRGERAISLLKRGNLDVLLSLPVPPNQPKNHTQDELYVIVRGRGAFVHEGKREPFDAGDCIFVPAGVEHHFEDFTPDVAVWVIFHGPPGGEPPS